MIAIPSEEDFLYCVVVRDPLTKRPIEYALFQTESEAIEVMSNLLSKGTFAAVAKKRIKSKKIP